jgi:hypothetical protein
VASLDSAVRRSHIATDELWRTKPSWRHMKPL